jgi:hypothetical protein
VDHALTTEPNELTRQVHDRSQRELERLVFESLQELTQGHGPKPKEPLEVSVNALYERLSEIRRLVKGIADANGDVVPPI